MPGILREKVVLLAMPFFNYGNATPLTQDLYLAGESSGQTDSRPQQLSGNWTEQEDAKHHNQEEDPELEQLMENVKRYIRNIDVNKL
ncbi:MAG: hypothetical protein ACLFVT_06455 [Syntrophobacteria bacterium]